MPTDPRPVSVADVVRRAVAAVDGTGVDADVGRLLERFEDSDQPVSDPDETRRLIADAVSVLDPAGEDGALRTAGAAAVYLAYRRDEIDVEPGELIRLAVRAEFHGAPPEPVERFLGDAGFDA